MQEKCSIQHIAVPPFSRINSYTLCIFFGFADFFVLLYLLCVLSKYDEAEASETHLVSQFLKMVTRESKVYIYIQQINNCRVRIFNTML